VARGDFEDLHDRLPPGAVFTSSETRLDLHRERIVSATNAPVANREMPLLGYRTGDVAADGCVSHSEWASM